MQHLRSTYSQWYQIISVPPGKKKVVKLTEKKAKQQVIKSQEIRKLAEIALKLEEHYQTPQDIEFAIESGEVYIVQTRPVTTLEKRVEKGTQKEIKGDIILKGLAASPGIATGKIKIIEDLKDLSKIQTGDILVTKMTNPDMVVTMQKSAAIVTDDGGMTWKPAPIYGGTDMNGIYFVDENRGWIVGAMGTYIFTTDGGGMWNMGTAGYFGNMNDIYFKDEQNGWIVGAEGTILETKNGGNTWNELPRLTESELYEIFHADGSLWAVGKWGIILKKTL